VFFAAAFANHDTLLERAGDVIGLVGGVVMSLRIHGLNRHHPAPGALGLEGVRAYRASLERLRIANDISWQTIMILQAAFALPLAAVAVERRPNALLVVAFQLSIRGSCSPPPRMATARLRRQIASSTRRREWLGAPSTVASPRVNKLAALQCASRQIPCQRLTPWHDARLTSPVAVRSGSRRSKMGAFSVGRSGLGACLRSAPHLRRRKCT
jgi:hypothetical protein